MTMQARTTAMRRAVMVAAVLLVAAAGVWAMLRTDAPAAAQPRVALATAQDPHAGHAMPAADDDGVVHLPPEMVASLGVTTVAAELAPLTRTIRTTGNVVYDETRLTTITPKFAGFVERLHVDFTGQPVRRGQPLLEIYSPELVAAQDELLTALRMQAQLREGASPAVIERTAELVDAARRRLLQWDVSAAQVAEVERSGRARRTLTMHASSGGFVTEKMVQSGQAVEAGMALYRLADLSSVWVEADIYEQDLRFVEVGQVMQVEIAAWPGETFRGRISYVYPEVRLDTRTARIRISLANPGGRVKPGMFATAQLETAVTESAVLVPRDAVMHSGSHAMVFIDEGAGVYRARQVVVGADMSGRTQILSGLQPGERVVQRANFLIDSESRLVDAPGTMSGMNH
ncbi:MAG TPA: efflux RND transporter periplasmic adaptor subunit [Longimicrobiales bacterium]|nr:efflux RND transporter periplasmic adaptor subunit [Longimicrobiales bacterium]